MGATYNSDGLVTKFIGIVVFCVLVGALLPTVIASINNITSVSNLLFAAVIGSIFAILLGVFILKSIIKHLN
jgi:hypothetical protein